METIALHCRRAIMSWMCKDARGVMFARNHNDSRLFRTTPCASIWISTQVSARLVLYAALGLLFREREILRQFADWRSEERRVGKECRLVCGRCMRVAISV